ncbi:MAG: hypothetical protein M4579_002488 [Chaenotheca gracillima]|nr:MAG: hypothetical protein M4579_002488 [Chaenotheca gracillima]
MPSEKIRGEREPILIEDVDENEPELRGLNSRASSLTIVGDPRPERSPDDERKTSFPSASFPAPLPTGFHPSFVLDLRSKSPEISRHTGPREQRSHHNVIIEDETNVDEPTPRGFLSPEDFMSDGEFEEVFSVTSEENPRPQHLPRARRVAPRPAALPMRNGPLPANFERLESFTFGNPRQTLRTNKAIELDDGDILHISSILQDRETTEIRLRGLRYRRTKFMNGLLPKLRNEVCLILEVELDDSRPARQQCVEEVPLSECGSLRRLLFTNAKYPSHSFVETEPDGQNTSDDVVFSQCQLVCRWTYLCSFRNALARKNNQYSEKSLQCLRKTETDVAIGVDEDTLRENWRGTTVKGGDFELEKKSDIATSRPNETLPESTKTPKSSSSYIDLLPSGSRAGSPIELEPSSPTTTMQRNRRERPEIQAGRPRVTQRLTFDTAMRDRRPTTIIDDSDEEKTTNLSKRTGTSFRKNEPQSSSSSFEIAQSISTSQAQDRDYQISARFKARSKEGQVDFECTGTIRPEQTPSTPKRSRSGFVEGQLSPPSSRKRLQRSRNNQSETPGRKTSTTHSMGPIVQPKERKYTFGDVFCGAGGASRGAHMAGLQVMWGVDKDFAAVQTYQQNFEGCGIWHMEINDLVALISEDLKVDLLHLSPPCQYFSPAHTVDGKDDETNTAAFFSTDALLKVTKPRIVTLENTSGLTERHGQWANAAIQMFTQQGFSVRWRLINCADLGCAQARHRMFLIASCPGEALPEFPDPTHSADPEIRESRGLLPSTTVTDAIADIPDEHANHNPELMPSRNYPPYDPNLPLRACITTSGGGNYHPSGRRDLTHREFACLQGFPLEHVFVPPGVKRQIGNAVPPVVGKTIFESIKQALLQKDGLD